MSEEKKIYCERFELIKLQKKELNEKMEREMLSNFANLLAVSVCREIEKFIYGRSEGEETFKQYLSEKLNLVLGMQIFWKWRDYIFFEKDIENIGENAAWKCGQQIQDAHLFLVYHKQHLPGVLANFGKGVKQKEQAFINQFKARQSFGWARIGK